MNIKADQPLQTKFQANLIKLHDVWMKAEDFFFAPIRKAFDFNTDAAVAVAAKKTKRTRLKNLSGL